MGDEWIKGKDGENLKFKRETLLNYVANRWRLNAKSSVGPTSALIRECSPKNIKEWKKYYFENATQKNGTRIDESYIANLGKRLFEELKNRVLSELNSIVEDECIDYMSNLVLNRTFEGYKSEIETIYGDLKKELEDVEIKPANDVLDRTYNVDFTIEIKAKLIGIQIKPIGSGKSINDYQWATMHSKAHKTFSEEFGGKVFFIYSVKAGDKKVIHNREIIAELKSEIDRLRKD